MIENEGTHKGGREGGREGLPAHDKLDGEDGAFLAHAGVGVRDGEDVVGHQVLGLVEPPGGGMGGREGGREGGME